MQLAFPLAAAGSTANDIARGFSTGASPGSTWIAGFIMTVCGLVVIGIVVSRIWWMLRASRTPHARLKREIRRTTGLQRSDLRCLQRVATQLGLRSPITLLLTPSLLQRVRQRLVQRDAEMVDDILLRLAQA